MPSKQEPRLMLLAALIRGSCTKCRIPIVIVRIFFIIYYYYYYYYYLLFRPKTERAAQTVRARELKFGQLVVVVAGTSNPKARPCRLIGGATEQSTRFSDIFGLSS